MGKRQTGLPNLSPTEWEIMKVMWKHGPMAARDVYARLSEERKWASSTVKTLLRRMVKKGWLDYQQIGNSYLYRGTVPREKALRAAIREFSGRVLDGVLSPFVAYYAEQKNLTPEDLVQLEEILKGHRQKGGEKDVRK